MRFRPTAAPVDQVRAETLVLGYYLDERPLKERTGLADWRLCGALSRLILDNRIEGALGDVLMLPVVHNKLNFKRVVLVGLGKKDDFGVEQFGSVLGVILDTLFKLKVDEFALELPGSDQPGIDPALALKQFCSVVGRVYRDDELLLEQLSITVMTSSELFKKVAAILEAFEQNIRASQA